MLLELIECEILNKMRPSFLNNLSLIKDYLIYANDGGIGGNRVLHLLLHLLEHFIILLLEVHLVRAPPTPSDLDLLPFDLKLLVEFSQESHRNLLTRDLLPLGVQ